MKTEQFNSDTQTSITISMFNELTKHLSSEPHYVVVWLDHQVRLGNWTPDGFEFYQSQAIQLEHIQRIRIFNAQEELHLWRSSKGLTGRLRRENGLGDQIEAVRARQILVGTASESLGNYTRIYEDRGYELILPLSKIELDQPGKRCYVETLNYLAFNELGQIGYIDCRFVSLGMTRGER